MLSFIQLNITHIKIRNVDHLVHVVLLFIFQCILLFLYVVFSVVSVCFLKARLIHLMLLAHHNLTSVSGLLDGWMKEQRQ